MNKNQIDVVKSHIDAYMTLELSELLAEKYANTADLNEVRIGEYTAKEFLSASNKVFNQFREEISTVFAKALPYQYHFHNEYGNANLEQDLTNYLNNVRASNFEAAITHLNRLIHYQAVNGFWEKTKRKYFRHSETSVAEEKERIGLVSKHLDQVSRQLEEILKEVDDRKSDLEAFTHAKSNELSEIASLLESNRAHSNEIIEIHNRASGTVEKINGLLEIADEKKDESEALLSEVRKESKGLKETIAQLEQTLQKQSSNYEKLQSEFEGKLSFVEGKTEYFKERNSYLDDLIGREVGASLFETFKQRKSELGSTIGFWKWSVPVTAVACILWIFFLFGNGDLSSLSWQVILINSLKALPALALLLFAISQYTKERNFQEEYAFKSAVALTVNSYAEQLKDEINQDRLIMDSVEQIYRTPLAGKNLKSKETASLLDTAKSLIEEAKNLTRKSSEGQK
ncbi:MAG: hypothetical protein H6998_18980 [Hahellaceae bacterium]|nr:hypothetical protein [Hahellaceae bacterium]